MKITTYISIIFSSCLVCLSFGCDTSELEQSADEANQKQVAKDTERQNEDLQKEEPDYSSVKPTMEFEGWIQACGDRAASIRHEKIEGHDVSLEGLVAYFSLNNIGFSVPDLYITEHKNKVVEEKTIKEFDLEASDLVSVEIDYRSDPRKQYPISYCTGDLGVDLNDSLNSVWAPSWTAVSGKMKVTIDKHPSGDPHCYLQFVELTDVVFQHESWEKDLTIEEFSFGEMEVDAGFYTGVTNCGKD